MCQDVVYELVNVWSFQMEQMSEQDNVIIQANTTTATSRNGLARSPPPPATKLAPSTRCDEPGCNINYVSTKYNGRVCTTKYPKVTAKRTRSRVRGQRDYVFERNAHTHQRPPAAPPTSVRFACPRARGRATSNTGDIEIYFEITNKSA